MAIHMHTVIMFTLEGNSWTPEVQVVDGISFFKIDCKDRALFKLCTDKAIKLGRKSNDPRYVLACVSEFKKARSDASQAAFETMHKRLQEDAAEAGGGAGKRRRKQRIRKARDSDALTVGEKVMVVYEHGDDSRQMLSLFGTSTSHLWIDATVENLQFISNAMRSDYQNVRFAGCRPRGPHFRRELPDTAGAEREPEHAEAEGSEPEHAAQDENVSE